MDTKVNYTVVGLFVIVLAVAMVSIFLWLTTMKHDKFTETYVTYTRDDVSGLNVQSPVRFNGVKVGYVSSILISKKDPQQVEVVMKLAKDAPISTSTVSTLNPQGITGLDYISLQAKTNSAPRLRRQAGQRYPVIPAEPSLLMRLSTVIKQITQSISQLTDDVNQVLNKKNRQSLSNSLMNLDKITQTVAINSEQINRSLQSINVLLGNSAVASKQFPQLLQDIKETLQATTNAANQLAKSGEIIGDSVNEAASSVDQISQHLVPGTQQLLQRLNATISNLQSLTYEFEQDPAMLVRGKVPAPPGPGEK